MSALVIMGSGETAPTLVPVHREIFAATRAAVGGRQVRAVQLDTPFGFQLNADELVARTARYLADSVGQPSQLASWRRADVDSAERERALAVLHGADWVLAGPGSPSYALRQWLGTPVPDAMADVVQRGGTLVLGSAAAVTAGSHAIGVYEIYKAGHPPRWLDGLDLLARLTGLHAAVVPHYDNTEGGTHDTRFCYLGEPRLAALEGELPDDVGVLGVDEHTAAWFDLETRTVRVLGRGGVTVRRRGRSTVFATGQVVDVDTVDALLRGERAPTSAPGPAVPQPVSTPASEPVNSLRQAARDATAAFDAAVAARDAARCAGAVLELEQAIHDWSSDTLQSDEGDVARRTLRALVVRLGDLAAQGVRDPREPVAPFVEALLAVRAGARALGDYAGADAVRDQLLANGIEVRDSADGVQWDLRGGASGDGGG